MNNNTTTATKQRGRPPYGFIPNEFRLNGNEACILLPTRNGIREAVIDAEDLDRVLQKGRWVYLNTGYAVCRPVGQKPRQSISLHRFLIGAPDGYDVDHINRIRHDCRKSNLRIVTRSQNQQNRTGSPINATGHKHLLWIPARKAYQVRLTVNGKIHCSRQFKLLDDAIEASIQLRRELHTHCPENSVKE